MRCDRRACAEEVRSLRAKLAETKEALRFMAQEFEWLVSAGKVKGFDMTRQKAKDALNV